MGADVVVIGLDAAQATLLEAWARDGALPTFAHLQANGAVARLSNSLETLPGSIWPELATGVSGGRLGLFYHPEQIHTGEATQRPVDPRDVDSSRYYWVAASDAGKRVAAIDIPQTVPPAELNGIQVFEWGLHDRNFDVSSRPPGLIDDLRRKYGVHPVESCDDFHHGTVDGYRSLRAALLDGVERKTEMLVDLLSNDDWDLFAATFGESHCVGHQLWHWMEADDAPADLRDAILDVYRAIDRGVGAVIDAAGPAARVLVVASHGMGPATGGPQLLPEVLVRLGLGSTAGVRMRARTAIPQPVRAFISRFVPRSVIDRSGVGVGFSSRSLDTPGVRAIAVHNNRCGGIRINLAGREPHGCVRPGAELDELVATIRRELLALLDPRTSQPIVTNVTTSDEIFGPDHHPDLPDIIVGFRTDLGSLDACESPAVGLVESPVWVVPLPRTGDHVPESRLWAIGPGLTGTTLPEGNVLDLAPTVLDLLGVPVPPGLDGKTMAPLLAFG